MKRRNVVAGVLLLLAIAAVAYWLSQRGLASAIEIIGGQVQFDPESPDGPTVSVVLIGRPVRDGDLACLRGRRAYQRLFLDSTRITGTGLSELSSADQLLWLSLGNCALTDDGLRHLPTLPGLILLNLNRTRVTNIGLVQLEKLPRLQHLYVCQTAITDEGLEHLKKLPELEELDARETAITEAGVRRLQKALPKLTKFQIGKDEG